MAYSVRQASSYGMNMSSTSVGYGDGSGGLGQCGVGGSFGQGGGGYSQGYDQGAGSYGHAAGGFGHGASGFGQGGVGFGHGAGGFGQGGGHGFGGGFGGGHGFGGGFGADGAGFGGGESIFSVNDKETMQNLNGRLATYIAKVQDLENRNKMLEQNMKEFYEKQRPGSTTGEGPHDYSKYNTIIKETQDNIVKADNDNANILLATDNARLAADDFKMKRDTENALRRNVEADIAGLHNVLKDLNASNADLESHQESLIEELASIKKSKEEETKGGQQTTVGDVNVEMNAAPADDLLNKLNDLRQRYEALAEKNRKDAEDQFKKMSEGLKKEISEGTKTESSSKSEASELKKTVQTLEIELQSLHAQKISLENSLRDTEGRFCMRLAQIQAQIVAVEEQLSQIRAEIECQTAEYEDLLDIKSRLESEIAMYDKILKEGSSSTGQSGSETSGGKGTSTGSASSRATGTGSTSGRR